MSQVAIQQGIELALQHRQAGRIDQAEAIYRQLEGLAIDDAAGLLGLGVAAQKSGFTQTSLRLLGRAVALQPDLAEAHNAMGVAHRSAGKLAEALAAFELARKNKPDNLDNLFNLGMAYQALDRPSEALQTFDKMISLSPSCGGAHFQKARTLDKLGRAAEAIECYRQTVNIHPDLAAAWHHLGFALASQRRFEEALPVLLNACRLNPRDADILASLGVTLHELRRLSEAVDAFKKALDLQPNTANLLCHLGNVLWDQSEIDQSVAHFRRAVSLQPDNVQANSNLARAVLVLGSLDEAIALYRKLTQLVSDNPTYHDSLLNCLRVSDVVGIDELLGEFKRWSDRFESPVAGKIPIHVNDRSPDRKLRIGYVSPDLHIHPVATFLLPILAQHDRTHFHITCYKNITVEDEMTARLRTFADNWRMTALLRDEDLARQIIDDRIDILVDLTQHFVGNRLILFARKPAPVQVTYLGSPGTTGLRAFDAQLSDPYIDPPGQTEQYSTEPIERLETYWCYVPNENAPPVAPLPAMARSVITFGVFNRLAKSSPCAMKTWAAVLKRVPKSRLLMIATQGAHRQRILDHFIDEGIEPSRIELVAEVPNHEYLLLYHRIDIALDTFPFNGGTTTCQALWMGVPVVTLAGVAGGHRSGVSVLNNVGLPELIATTKEQYLQIAAELAGDLSRLSDIRQSMRQENVGVHTHECTEVHIESRSDLSEALAAVVRQADIKSALRP